MSCATTCTVRGHRDLEGALTKMREERNALTKRCKSLHGNLVGLGAKAARLEEELAEARRENATLSASLDEVTGAVEELANRVIAKEGK